jgi:hypothetical protein
LTCWWVPLVGCDRSIPKRYELLKSPFPASAFSPRMDLVVAKP